MLHASRRRGSHQYIYSHDTQAYRHAAAAAARDASRRWMTSKPGTASRRRRAVMQNTADRRRRGAVSCPTDSPATLLIAHWSNRSPPRRRLQQNRPVGGGVGDATWSMDCVTRRRASIQSLHERLQSLMPRAEAQYSFDGSGADQGSPRAPENTRARRHFVTRRRASTGPAHEVLTSKRSLWRRGATRSSRRRRRRRSRPRARALVVPAPRSRRGASTCSQILHSNPP